MMSSVFSDEAIELIMSNIYTNPSPLSPPSSHFVGFFRFLSFLSKCTATNLPAVLIVDFGGYFEKIGIQAVQVCFFLSFLSFFNKISTSFHSLSLFLSFFFQDKLNEQKEKGELCPALHVVTPYMKKNSILTRNISKMV